MKTENQFLKRSSLFVAFLLMLLTAFSAQAQKVFDNNNPVGRYIITDYLNRRITLNINKSNGTHINPATIVVNGRNLVGKWHVTSFNGEYYLCFESYDYVRFSYALPSETVKTDQIIISQDGRASYNASVLMGNSGDWIKARRASAASKKSTPKKKSKRK